jgi:hypothetical protein
MAQIVAKHLHLPMDLIVPEKKGSASLSLPSTCLPCQHSLSPYSDFTPHLPIPAFSPHSPDQSKDPPAGVNDLGEGYWSPRFLQRGSSHYGWTDASPAAVHRVHNAEHKEAESTAAHYRGSLPPLYLQGKTVILVDEALIAPSSIASVLFRLHVLGAEGIVIAVSVGSLPAINEVRPKVEDVTCLCQRADCHDVEQRFEELQLVTEEEVMQCMQEEGERRRKGAFINQLEPMIAGGELVETD